MLRRDKVLEETLTALSKNGFRVFFAKGKEEAKDTVLKLISPEESIGVGGSITIREIGLLEALEERGNKIFQHWIKGLSPKEFSEALNEEVKAEVFLTSSNAVTRDGKLVNKDMTGNRVSAMIFGPKKVIVVVGINKIVSDVNEALDRIRNIAAPLNAKRIGLKTPCAITGVCNDCDSPDRICRVTTIIEKCPSLTEMNVILVNEELGY